MVEVNDALIDELAARLSAEAELISELWSAMRKQLEDIGISSVIAEKAPDFKVTQIKYDTYDGSESLYGEWHKLGAMCGSFIAHAGGSAFAEIDVLREHPIKTDCFIEAVTAWGRVGAVSAELKVLPKLQ